MASSTASPDSIIEILRRMDEEFGSNAKTGNAQLLVERFYAEDACLLPPNREAVRGSRAITQVWKGVIAAGLKDIRLETTQFDVHGDMAYGIGMYHMTVEVPGGPRTEQIGKYLVVYRRMPNGDWKAVADMFSPNS